MDGYLAWCQLLLTLNGFIHWRQMGSQGKGLFVLASVLLWPLLLPLHLFVYLAQAALNAYHARKTPVEPGEPAPGVFTGTTPPATGRTRDTALGIGCATLLVTGMLCGGIATAANGGVVAHPTQLTFPPHSQWGSKRQSPARLRHPRRSLPLVRMPSS